MNWDNSPPFGRRVTLIDTLNRFTARKTGEQYILEIGTSEMYSPDGLGNAMLAFGWYAFQIGGVQVHTVDIREVAVQNSGAILRHYCPEATQHCFFRRMDAFEYANCVLNPDHEFYLPRVDLIYYDGPSEPYSWYIELHNRLKETFSVGALALFDDTDPHRNYAGKGSALIPKLLSDGWRQLPVAMEPGLPMVLLERMA